MSREDNGGGGAETMTAAGPQQRENTRYIVAGTLIDGSGDPAQRNVCLAVRDGRIVAMGPAAELQRRPGMVVEDLSYGTVVPPLVDCCLSLGRSPALTAGGAGDAASATSVAQRLGYCHAHGVLGLADSGGDLPLAVGETAARAGVVALRRAGRDFLCLAAGEAVAGGGPEPLAPDALRRRLAANGHRPALVVANGASAVAAALDAGCDAIVQGYEMGEDNLRRMAAIGVVWLPCLVVAKNGVDGSRSGGTVCCRFSLCYAAPGQGDPAREARWRQLLAGQMALLRRARQLGVRLAIATFAGSPGIIHGEAVVEEMKLFRKAGIPLGETVRAATASGAALLAMDDLGALRPGGPATFLVARGGAQQLPRKLAYLEAIWINGRPSPAYRKDGAS